MLLFSSIAVCLAPSRKASCMKVPWDVHAHVKVIICPSQDKKRRDLWFVAIYLSALSCLGHIYLLKTVVVDMRTEGSTQAGVDVARDPVYLQILSYIYIYKYLLYKHF